MFTGPLPALVNYSQLALENSKLEGTVALSKFERFVELLESAEGVVQVKLEFREVKKQRTMVVGQATSLLRVVCQNCLSTMDYGLEVNFRHLIVNSEDDLRELSEDEDGIVCIRENVSLVAIIEDELIMSLPMVSRHDDQCQPITEHKNNEDPIKPETNRPFAGLAELTNELKRS